jgi:hypothetical protein
MKLASSNVIYHVILVFSKCTNRSIYSGNYIEQRERFDIPAESGQGKLGFSRNGAREIARRIIIISRSANIIRAFPYWPP